MSGELISNNNQKWISLIVAVVVPISIAVGSTLYNNQQAQIDRLRTQVQEQQRTGVTETKLNREIERVIQIVDLKLSSIQKQQEEINKQLSISLEQNREFQKEMREKLSSK